MNKIIFAFVLLLSTPNAFGSPMTLQQCISACHSGDFSKCIVYGSAFPQFSEVIPTMASLNAGSIAQFPCGKKITVDEGGLISSSDYACKIASYAGPTLFLPQILSGKWIQNELGNVISFDEKASPQISYVGSEAEFKEGVISKDLFIWTTYTDIKSFNCFGYEL